MAVARLSLDVGAFFLAGLRENHQDNHLFIFVRGGGAALFLVGLRENHKDSHHFFLGVGEGDGGSRKKGDIHVFPFFAIGSHWAFIKTQCTRKQCHSSIFSKVAQVILDPSIGRCS